MEASNSWEGGVRICKTGGLLVKGGLRLGVGDDPKKEGGRVMGSLFLGRAAGERVVVVEGGVGFNEVVPTGCLGRSFTLLSSP